MPAISRREKAVDWIFAFAEITVISVASYIVGTAVHPDPTNHHQKVSAAASDSAPAGRGRGASLLKIVGRPPTSGK